MNDKTPKKADRRREFRRLYDQLGDPLPPPAETHQEAGGLVMTVEGVRYVGKRLNGAFVWVQDKSL